MKFIYKSWPFHNIVAHPIMEVLYWFGLNDLANTVHDGTIPEEVDETENQARYEVAHEEYDREVIEDDFFGIAGSMRGSFVTHSEDIVHNGDIYHIEVSEEFSSNESGSEDELKTKYVAVVSLSDPQTNSSDYLYHTEPFDTMEGCLEDAKDRIVRVGKDTCLYSDFLG